MRMIVAKILLSSLFLAATRPCLGADGPLIVIGAKATSIEHYAARELQRYLYQLSATLPEIAFATDNRRGPVFLLGRAETNPAIQRLVDAGQLTVSDKDPGPQGYVLKKFDADGREGRIVIAGSDALGCLYGVYGLLEDYYGLGFYLGGDVFAGAKSAADPKCGPTHATSRGCPRLSSLDQLPPVGNRLLLARLAVHHRSNRPRCG